MSGSRTTQVPAASWSMGEGFMALPRSMFQVFKAMWKDKLRHTRGATECWATWQRDRPGEPRASRPDRRTSRSCWLPNAGEAGLGREPLAQGMGAALGRPEEPGERVEPRTPARRLRPA